MGRKPRLCHSAVVQPGFFIAAGSFSRPAPGRRRTRSLHPVGTPAPLHRPQRTLPRPSGRPISGPPALAAQRRLQHRPCQADSRQCPACNRAPVQWPDSPCGGGWFWPWSGELATLGDLLKAAFTAPAPPGGDAGAVCIPGGVTVPWRRSAPYPSWLRQSAPERPPWLPSWPPLPRPGWPTSRRRRRPPV